jgi:hypothetical protein
LRLVPDESGQQPLAQRLRAVIAAKDEQIAVLQAQVEAVLAREHRLELRVAELERRLSMDCLLTEQRPVFLQFRRRVAASVNTVPGHDQRECS